MTFLQEHWYLKDLQYTYLPDGFTLVATTDVACHLFCRMTTTPPRKHALPSYRRGLYLQGDIRFCFVVYEDNEQEEPGDTLIHTFLKPAWPVCETRWFYFIGNIAGIGSVSESPIFEFHFPRKPPPPTYITFNLEVDADGIATGIRFISPEAPPTHWDKVRYEDTTWDPDYGIWGRFTGTFVYEKVYYGNPINRDLYSLQDPPNFELEVIKIITHALAGKSTYPYGDYYFEIYPGYPGHASPQLPLDSGLNYYSYDWPLNPNTGNKWTLNDLKTLQAGIAIGNGAWPDHQICDHFWLEVLLET